MKSLSLAFVLVATLGVPDALGVLSAQAGAQTNGSGRALDSSPPQQKVVVPVAPPNPIPINALPYSITQPGYYKVTHELSGTAGQNGITVFTEPVVIDLNGQILLGGAGSGFGISGVGGLVVFNGTLHNWGAGGISAGTRATLINVVISLCGGDGMSLGQRSIVQDCLVGGSGDIGIKGRDLTVLDSIVEKSTAEGIRSEGGRVVVRRSRVKDNGGIGITALDPFGSGNEAIVEECQLIGNAGGGLDTTEAALVTGCTVRGNGGVGGIRVGDASSVERCLVLENELGIVIDGAGSRVASCTVRGSTSRGITLGSDNVVVDNAVLDNAQNGILANGTGNRIENNNVARNGIGIAVPGQRNWIVRNTLDSNAVAMQIAADNIQGPFLKMKGFIQSENPWANFDLSFPATFP